jgi:hypothetical protein
MQTLRKRHHMQASGGTAPLGALACGKILRTSMSTTRRNAPAAGARASFAAHPKAAVLVPVCSRRRTLDKPVHAGHVAGEQRIFGQHAARTRSRVVAQVFEREGIERLANSRAQRAAASTCTILRDASLPSALERRGRRGTRLSQHVRGELAITPRVPRLSEPDPRRRALTSQTSTRASLEPVAS